MEKLSCELQHIISLYLCLGNHHCFYQPYTMTPSLNCSLFIPLSSPVHRGVGIT